MTIDAFWEQLKKHDDFALFMHVRPDGDTVGGALALKNALQKIGKKADVFCDDYLPEKFSYLKGYDTVNNKIDRDYGAYVAVDCSELSRLGRFAALFNSNKVTFNLDHHVSNTKYARYNCVLDVSANCQNVLALINFMGDIIDKDIADALYTGVITDTGNFSHKNATPETLIAGAVLVSKGADLNGIYRKMFKNQSKERAKLFGMCMSKIRYFLDDTLAVATVSLEDLEKAGAKPDVTEGFIDFVMGIECVEVGICILQVTDKSFKISFRSKGTDVNAVAGVFGGGGHTLASGCMINGYYEDVVDRLVYACKQHM